MLQHRISYIPLVALDCNVGISIPRDATSWRQFL